MLTDDDNVVDAPLTSVSVNSPAVVEMELAIVLCVVVSAGVVNGVSVSVVAKKTNTD